MILSHQKFDFEGKCLVEKVVIRAPYRFSTSFQDEACFIYFVQGKTLINSPHEQEWIEPGESVLLKCGHYFSDLKKFGTANQYEIIVFHLYPDALQKIYANDIPAFFNPSDKKKFIRKIASAEIVGKFIEGLYFYFENPALVSEELLVLKIKELILLLLQSKDAESMIDLFSDLFTPRTLSLKEVVNNHLFSKLSIGDLAGLSNMSVSTFNRSFQQLFGDTPANYIKQKRLERARELLKLSTLSISEIAMQTCFNDAAHFSRSFKEHYHLSPKAYRTSWVVD